MANYNAIAFYADQDEAEAGTLNAQNTTGVTVLHRYAPDAEAMAPLLVLEYAAIFGIQHVPEGAVRDSILARLVDPNP